MENLTTTEGLRPIKKEKKTYDQKPMRWALTDKEKKLMADIRKCLTELEDLCK